MSRFASIFISILTLTIFWTSNALACSSVAIMVGPPSQATLEKVDIAFVGKAVSTRPTFQRSKRNTQVTTFKITKIYKGSSRYKAAGLWGRRVKIYHSTDSGWCGTKFKRGKRYTVRAHKVKGKLTTSAHGAQPY